MSVASPLVPVLAVWLTLALAGPATSQVSAPPSEPSSPIPVPEIARRAAEVDALLGGLDALTTPDREVQAIEDALPVASERIRTRLDRTRERLEADPSLAVLDELARDWQGTRAQLDTWADRLAARGIQLQQEIERLSTLRETWVRSRDEARLARAPAPLIEQIDGILTAISSARARLNARLAALLVLQYRIRQELRRCDDAQRRVARTKADMAARVATRDGLPILSAELWTGAASQLAPAFGDVAAGARDAARSRSSISSPRSSPGPAPGSPRRAEEGIVAGHYERLVIARTRVWSSCGAAISVEGP